MTPKSLLRNPQVSSSLRELASGGWQPVIDDSAVEPEVVTRLILCSGKVSLDLANSDARKAQSDTAVVRVEQLYPFPAQEIKALLNSYKHVESVHWVQEEPENMGAWDFAHPLLRELIGDRPLGYVGRGRMSSPAEGSASQHQQNQAALVNAAFTGNIPAQASDIVMRQG
jgi:2-oxoglutarate dehydrogenase E1 component